MTIRTIRKDRGRPAHADGTEEWMAFFNDNEGRPLAIMSAIKG